MKDEIKEILDELESLFEISEAPEHIINGFNKIKDYITNLQEKYKSSQITLAEEWKKRLEVEEENKRLKENAIHNDKVVDKADETINNQFFKIDRLIYIISETSKHIQHELSHLKANDEVSWNEEFYTNNKLDYRKLCIALLEQVLNKLQGVGKDE